MTRIAYLVSEYPAPSHTFIRREIAALRRAGLDIVTFSIRVASVQADNPLHAAARAETKAVLGSSPFAYLSALCAILARHPVRAMSTLVLAMRHRAPGMRALLWAFFHFAEAMVLATLLRRTEAGRLHVHFANSGATVGMLAAKLVAIPWSMTLHGISETDYPSGLLLKGKIASADFVGCASWFMRAQAMRVSSSADWSKLQIVRCGVDPDDMPVSGARVGEPLTFVCVGRLSNEKGHRGLIEAFLGLREHHSEAQLELVGDGPLREDLTMLVRALGMENAVHFHGALSEANTLSVIAAADALVLPSLMEGLPVVIMEAMALSKPVVSSCIAGIPELVKDNVNGLLFPPSDWQALTQAMGNLASDKGLREALGTAAQESMRPDFLIEFAVKPLVTLFARNGN